MRAELQLFSGRPNPTWNLTQAQIEQFSTRLQALAEIRDGEADDGLGYWGIIVQAITPTNGNGTMRQITISRGIVIVEQGGSRRTYADSNRELERWLFQTSRNQIDQAIYDMIARDLGIT
ncbi:MAG: hypothetical protein SH847_15580 [Roseiflexaceae bacterium]|nr:hypothetical protein [Roseiflexaceae bacterium]